MVYFTLNLTIICRENRRRLSLNMLTEVINPVRTGWYLNELLPVNPTVLTPPSPHRVCVQGCLWPALTWCAVTSCTVATPSCWRCPTCSSKSVSTRFTLSFPSLRHLVPVQGRTYVAIKSYHSTYVVSARIWKWEQNRVGRCLDSEGSPTNWDQTEIRLCWSGMH